MDKSYRRNIHIKLKDVIPEDILALNNKKKAWKRGYIKEYDVVNISKDGTIGEVIEINELKIALPLQPKKIRNQNLANKDQKWRRYEVPKELLYFDKYYGKDDNVNSTMKMVFNRYKDFIKEDIERKFMGDWFMNDGETIYITGYYYFFLQHYFLTDLGRYGDFRMPQRDYFIWVEACFADERCLGSELLKSRRMSFSTSSCCILICNAITRKNGFYPIVSKKDTDASKMYEKHILKPFLVLPKHLQPQRTGEVAPKKELTFSAAKKKLTTNNSSDAGEDGLDTTIKFYSTTLDAYDGMQVTISINDEIGKLKGGLDVNEYWEQAHKMCHIVGGKVVGKALCGSTANPPNKGGRNYEKFYKNSQLGTRNETGQTTTGLYSIFIPTDYTTMGFFDEFGYVIYDTPKEPILNELGEYQELGVKEYLDRKELACGNDAQKLNAQRRNEPRTDRHPFLDEEVSSMYGTAGMLNHINFLKTFERTEKYKSKVFRFNLVWKNGVVDSEVEMVRSDTGRFVASWLPPKEMRNKFKMSGNKKKPVNSHLGCFGADPYQADRVKYGKGSKQGFVGVTSDNQNELAERDRNLTFLFYNFKPDTIEIAEEDIIKAIVYFSMPILPETNKESLVKKLFKRGYRGYVLNNPFKSKKDLTHNEAIYGGVFSSNNNIRNQEEALETYVHNNIMEVVDEDNIKVPFLELNEQAELYNSDTRTKLDAVVAWQLAVAGANRNIRKKVITEESETFENVDIYNLFTNN